MKISINLDNAKIRQIEQAAKGSAAEALEVMYTDLVSSKTMPFDTGDMQNNQTFVESTETGAVLITGSPQARRLYYHPERLKYVVIEHKDFENLISVYDRPGALFYCDPPYHKTEKYYNSAFSNEDHERLNTCLKAIKGRFILSYNDDEYIRELYKDFDILPVERQNNLSKGTFKELIIKNY